MDIDQMIGGGAMMVNGGVSPFSRSIPGVDVSIDMDDEQRKKVAKDFESIIIQQMMDTMKATIPEEESEDCASGQIKSMYWAFMSQAVSDQGGMGLWKDIYKNLCDNANVSKGQQATDQLDGRV